MKVKNNMKVRYLGTAASEGFPAVFCNCEYCQTARKTGEFRTRSQVLIEDNLLIDFPPETYLHAVTGKIDLSAITCLLVTHSHTDHFYAQEFVNRGYKFAYGLSEKTLNIYGNKAVKEVYRDKKITEEVLQLLMAFSASGIITNTFSHELSRVSEKVGDKMLHVRSCIDDILNYQPYNGDEIFNPYPVIEDALENDRVMKSWLDITMKAIKEKQFEEDTVDLAASINEINQIWEPLMRKKLISVSMFDKDDCDKYHISIAKIDLFTIINNLNLNSAYFLEKKTVEERRIDYRLSSEKGIITLRMVNNGPALDEKYKHAPNKIFLARETSKGEEGTGLGLWIVDRIINKYNATINVLDMEDGFGLEIYFNQEAIHE